MPTIPVAFSMANASNAISMERLLRPLRRELTADMAAALLRVKADAEVQARYEILASRNTEGTLTPKQRVELEWLVRANSLLTVLKAEARSFLKKPKAA
jgi:hypothetical protein